MSLLLQRWFFLITILLLSFTAQQANASHAMGADLTYQCVGGNAYKVRLSFYRDCIGIAAPTSVYINVRSVSCGQNIGVTAYPVAGTGQEVNYLCPTAVTTCNGGTFTGIQEYVYEGVITLPMQCTDWTFSYTLCCRNAAITTITSPSSNTFYIYATLNNTISPCNSSPTFSNKPVPFACLGQQLCFNHGAVDADGDSLVYSLVNPKQTATTNINYLAPYNANNPLNSLPAMQFNPQTGDVCFTPQQLQVSVMAVLVREFRNGVLIGSVVRDIQVTVLNCSNNLPTLTGINGTNDFTMDVCANTPTCFNVFSNDADASQNVSVFWNSAIDSATFTTAGTPHPTGTFCWTPTTADISNTPYCFTVRVSDDACPFVGAQTYSYCITVKGIKVDLGPDRLIACSDLTTITANASGGNPPYSYLWSNGFTGPTQTLPVGNYVVTVSDGSCSSTDTVRVISAFEPTADFTYAKSCLNLPVIFTDNSTIPGQISTWNWNFGDNSTSTVQNPTHTYASAGTYTVTLVVENIFGCIDSIVQTITAAPLPNAAFSVSNSCASSFIQINNTTTPSGTSWNWTFSNGTTSTIENPIITISTPGSYSGTLIVEDSLGCRDTVTQNFIVNPSPVAAFTTTGTSCQNGTVTFNNTSTGNPTSWNWNFGDGQTSTQQNPTHVFTNSGTYGVTLIVTNSFGCIDTLLQNVIINAPPIADAGPDKVVCLGSSVNLTAAGGGTYNWNPGGLSGSTVSVSPSNDTSYVVIVTDANGCTDTDTVRVRVNPLPIPVVSPNQTVCAGQSVTLTASGGISYNWNPSGSITPSITVTPSSSGTYAVDVRDANGCQNTAFVNITVNQNPLLTLPTPVFICNGDTTILNPGNAGTSYQWNTGATTQTIAVNTQGTYSVLVTNQFGCTTFASTTVTVGGQVVSNVNAVSICAGQSATLSAGYTGSTYIWNTGATTQTITTANAGSYLVTVTDPSGCSGTIQNTVQVNALPVPNFTPVDVCLNQPVLFQDISTVNGDSIVSWSWNLGDGNVSYQQDPQHTYNASGSYVVNLTVTSSAGCSATLSDTLNVYPLPTANFNFSQGCEGTAINFIDQSTVGFGNVIGWNWNFGDNTSSTMQNPSHVYAAAGTYTVTLISNTAGGCSGVRTRIIQVYPRPVIAFTPSVTSVCIGSTVSFTNTSTSANGTINTWNWNFGNSTTSSSQQPSVTYTTPGTYTVTLTGTTSFGCVNTTTRTVTVNPRPIADAGSNQSICVGQSATLTGTGGGTYSWSTGATSASINVIPNATTTYYVTVTNSSGCTSRDSIRVTLRTLPTANAGHDRSICNGSSTTLTATGGGTYLWTPGGATTSTISVSPSSTINYIVTVTGSNGCLRNDTVRVAVNALPVASLGPDRAICQGSTATLIATGGTSYLWTHNGATTATVYVNPSVASSYSVTVTNAAGCTSRDTINVTLNPTPTVVLGNAFFCSGFSTTLDAGNAGMTYDWNPGGMTTQVVNISDPGQYNVVVTNSFGCQGTGVANVVEGGTGIVDNPINRIACQGSTITLDAGNPGLNYSWSTGATTQTINVVSTGIYDVTVTDASGCASTFSNNVIVNPAPTVDFTAPSACLGIPTQLVNNSTVSSGTIALWNWNLGNGNSSILQAPSQAYSTVGTYSISLVATTGAGCIDSVTKSVTIDPLPTANFTGNTVCEGSASQLTDLSTIPTGTINTWSWDLGNGQTSTTQSPAFTYNVQGTYVVTLIVSSTSGCLDTTFNSITVKPMPIAAFTAPEVCMGDSMQFTNASTIVNGQISDIAWDFGDGNTSTDFDPVHLYANPGSYTVSMSVGSDLACQSTVTQNVIVNDRPAANFTTAAICDGGSINITDLSTIANGTISSWYWNYGDGNGSNSPLPTYTYATEGSYTITLTATSAKGCTDSTSRVTSVNSLPVAAFATSNICLGSSTVFTDASTSSTGTIVSWNWNFGDNTTASIQNPQHTYALEGTYVVELIVTSSNGCTDTLQQSVNVFPVPTADFASADACLNTPNLFFDQSSINGGSQFTYAWTFGDSTTDTVMNPAHTYATPGNYTVNLTVTSPYGCSSSASRALNIYPNPIPSFVAGDVCFGQASQLTDASTISNGGISGWNWNLGDNSTTSAQNPTHYYSNLGTYVITLEVTSSSGCKGIFTDSIIVNALPTPMPTAGTGCVNDNISFVDTSSGANNIITNWLWNFGAGNTSTITNPSNVYTSAGAQLVSLTTTNANGCSATSNVTVTVSPLPIAGFISGAACANSGLQFTNTSSIANGTISGYQWFFGDSTTSTLANPSHIYANAGTYTVILIATSSEGCTDTIQGLVVVNSLPVANFNNPPVAACGPFPVQFSDSSYVTGGNVVSWFWDFGDGTSSTLQNPLHVYSASGSYDVSLTVTSDSGCTATITQNSFVTVYPGPQADFEPSPYTQIILDPNFDFENLSSGAVSYAWTFGDGTGSTLYSPSHTYRDTGSYQVVLWVTNTYGCTDSIAKTVRVDPEFTFWLPNTFTPNDDGVNETFGVSGISIADVKLYIFNRWGEEIYFGQGAKNAAWDGAVLGENDKAQEGVYVYMVEVKDVWGKMHQKVGQVNLVR
jgi:hypothetical protein